MRHLDWLPAHPDFRAALLALRGETQPNWAQTVALSRHRLDFVQTNALDSLAVPPPEDGPRPIKLAVLGSATLAHLHAGLRVAGLRRAMPIVIHENAYGQYLQELNDPASPLHAFHPDAVLLAIDARHVTQFLAGAANPEDAVAAAGNHLAACWRLARDAFGCAVIQQTFLKPFPPLMGNNEHRLATSPAAFIARLNAALRPLAATHGVDLLALDTVAARDGLTAWHDPGLWLLARQEITPAAAPEYGDLAIRLLAARSGRSKRCLVLDLDNTLWGGVVGDDGVEGLTLGQGSAMGEAFAAIQDYAKNLSRRGVILAVCSKNDEAAAVAPFENHPDMVLKREDIACFRANWDDKPANLRGIAEELSIGLDTLVFLDDNPFERGLVRENLPMVAVPELPEDPVLWPQTLAASGYFESTAITADDQARSAQYQQNQARARSRDEATDLDAYLAGLQMRLLWRNFDAIGLPRVVQLINKTNQFNLTTRRYTEVEVAAMLDDPNTRGIQFRLLDRFGDNGIIGVVILAMPPAAREALPPWTLHQGQAPLDRHSMVAIDTWLMSCRVLGRGVEAAMLAVTGKQALAMGADTLLGTYIPTRRNGMVEHHYEKLGFTVIARDPEGGSTALLDLRQGLTLSHAIDIAEG
jgi:FkbH-like protein